MVILYIYIMINIYIIFLIYILLIIILLTNNKNESFTNKNSKKITAELVRQGAGFYSLYFFLLNQYLYCKKYEIDFEIDSSKWLFKSINGWSDYFKDVKLVFNHSNRNEIINLKNSMISNEFIINDYKNAIKETYKYNKKIETDINNIYIKFNLKKGFYDAIFIRLGDKLISESTMIPVNKYIDLVLLKDPECKLIYVQTDDYSCYEECVKYINNNNLNIRVITNCNPNKTGVLVTNLQLNAANPSQQEYVDKLKNVKPVSEYNSSEIYEHVFEMISGIDIVLNSKYCITDYQSNVSRFIKLSHTNPNNVINVLDSDNDIDYNKIICPAYSF
jgi:hypothetical protein